MDPESKKILEETFTLAKENNQMLHSIRRSMIWSRVMNVIYWLVIIGASVGAYYFIEPYLNKVLDLYNSVSGMEQKVNNTTNTVQDILKIPDSLLKNFKIQ